MKVVLLAVRNSLLMDQCDAMHWISHSRDDNSSRSWWPRSSLAVDPDDQRVDVVAIRCGLPWKVVDRYGAGYRMLATSHHSR